LNEQSVLTEREGTECPRINPMKAGGKEIISGDNVLGYISIKEGCDACKNRGMRKRKK